MADLTLSSKITVVIVKELFFLRVAEDEVLQIVFQRNGFVNIGNKDKEKVVFIVSVKDDEGKRF